MRVRRSNTRLVLLASFAGLMGSTPLDAATFTPLSVLEDPQIWGTTGNNRSTRCAISGNGLVTAFESSATNLVPNDLNGRLDVFVNANGTLGRASRRVSGDDGRRDSKSAELNANGRYLVFNCEDDLLEIGNGAEQPLSAFRLDRQTGNLIRVSNRMNGSGASSQYVPAISGNGDFVFFISSDSDIVSADTNGLSDVYRFEVATGTTIRINTTSTGLETNNGLVVSSDLLAQSSDTSDDLVAFSAADGNLVSGDNNLQWDVFVKTISTGAIVRASQTSAGAAGNGNSFGPVLSSNGAFVAFTSSASNLVASDTNAVSDIFRVNLATGQVLRASEDATGTSMAGASTVPSISADGRFVYFLSSVTTRGGTSPVNQLFRKDLNTGTLSQLTNYTRGVVGPRVSASSGVEVACFETFEALDPNDSNGRADVYRLDISSSTFTRRSIANATVPVLYSGAGALTVFDVSNDGTRVLGATSATDLDADSFTEFTNIIGETGSGLFQSVLFESNTARLTGRSNGNGALPSEGIASSAALSGDGQNAVFASSSDNLLAGLSSNIGLFRQSLLNGVPQPINLGTNNAVSGNVQLPAADADGSRVVFRSSASNLVSGDTNLFDDIFLWDASAGITRVSVSSNGSQTSATSTAPDISGDGNWIVFESADSSLVSGDSNAASDVFLRSVMDNTTTRISLGPSATQLDAASNTPSISADARHIAYHHLSGSVASRGYYIYDRITQSTIAVPLPLGVTSTGQHRFGRDSRYLMAHATDGTGATAVYRYDLRANSSREVFRNTTNVYNSDNAFNTICCTARLTNATDIFLLTGEPLGPLDRNRLTDLLKISLDPGVINLTTPTLTISEGAGAINIGVARSGSAEGAVEVTASVLAQTASNPDDFVPALNELTWADNELATRQISISIIDDAITEPNETFLLQLNTPTGGATLGSQTQIQITILDNDFGDPIFANGFE